MQVKWYPLVMELVFETQTQKRRKSKSIKEKFNVEQSHGKLRTGLKCWGAKSQDPRLNIIFRWLGTSAICIFGTHRMSVLLLCIPVSTDSSNVHKCKNKIHFVTDFFTAYTKSVGLHVPGNIPFTFTEFYIVSTALRNVPFGIWEGRTLHCPDQDIFLRTTICKFPLKYFWSTAQIYVRSPLSLLKETTNNSKQ